MTLMNLGAKLQGAFFAVKGPITAQTGIRLLRYTISLIKMKSYGPPIVREWPGEGSVGGVGVTVIQSLVESFAVIESFKEHDGFYLVICSCKDFDPYEVWGFLETLGYRVIGADGTLVRLVKRDSWFRRFTKWAGWG